MGETETLKQRIVDLEKRIELLKHDLIHDELTGLKTRRFLEEEFSSLLQAPEDPLQKNREHDSYNKNIAVLFCDVDGFKEVNDTRGHNAGDIVLQKISLCMMSSVRRGDICVRWGGDEIVLLLLGIDEAHAALKAEEIRACIEGLRFPEMNGYKTTMSIGAALLLPQEKLESMVERADKAMYEAKRRGKNQIVRFSELKTQ